MKPCDCGSGKYIAINGGDGKCSECRRKKTRRERPGKAASREEQYGRYLDSGPANWDDKGLSSD